jgi:8-oxo-dGTP diphosphatase
MSGTIVVVAAVIERDGAFLLARRPAGTHLANQWEFPGGKVEPGERLDEGLRRELLEELAVHALVGREILTTTHAYPERTVQLHFFECEIEGEPQPLLAQEIRWVPRSELPRLELPEADAALIRQLARVPEPDVDQIGP